jgi:uroporphyrinogen-III synthase
MNGLPVIVLRPEPGNADTVARLAALGIVATSLPLFIVEPVAWDVPSTLLFDALLLTSASAVRHAGDAIAAMRALPALCVGEATATAAREAGLTVARVGKGGVSELLAEASDRLLWLCGENRSALPRRIAATVTAVPVYRARELDVSAGVLDQPCIAMLHSTRAAQRLAGLAGDRTSVSIVAISDAVAAAAGEGWRSVAIAPRPDDTEMVAIAAELCQDGSRRAHQ